MAALIQGNLTAERRKGLVQTLPTHSSGDTESEELQRLLEENAKQAAEIESLRAQLAEDVGRTSRRGLLKGLGLTSLIALGAGTGALSLADGVSATPSGVTETSGLAGDWGPFLELRLNGALVPGTSINDRVEGHIETLYYRQLSSVSSGSGQPGPRGLSRQPIIIRKRVDRATPLLLRGLANNESAEGTFRFRRTIEGETSDFYVLGFRGRIVEVEQYLPETLERDGKVIVGLLEQVKFSVEQFSVEHDDDGLVVTI